MNNPTPLLDTDELFHLAIAASKANKHKEAIEYLKQAQAQDPANAKVVYMLGAMHAQIGLYDRAASEMAKALEIDPTNDAARFQLGLLHATSGRPAEAEETWAALDALSKDHFLYLFKTGLVHLMKDQFEKCVDYLKQGIKANTFNDPLNRDMEKTLHRVEQAMATNTGSTVVDISTKTTKAGATTRVLSAYTSDEDSDKR